MGRVKKSLNEVALIELRKQGSSIEEISEKFEVSTATVSRRLADLRFNQGLLTKYRELQGLDLTLYKAKILEAITPEKIANASLGELAMAFKVISDLELKIQEQSGPKPVGLIAHIIEAEKIREKSVEKVRV